MNIGRTPRVPQAAFDALDFEHTLEKIDESLMEAMSTIQASSHPQCLALWRHETTGLFEAKPLSHEDEADPSLLFCGYGDEILEDFRGGRSI